MSAARALAHLLWLGVALAACSDARERVGTDAQSGGVAGRWQVAGLGDFNGDGFGDVLWTDPGTRRIAVFLLRGTRLLAPGPAIPGLRGAAWAPRTVADFDGDGMNDVIWSDPAGDRAAVWRMRGTHLAEPGPWIPGPPGDGWVLGYAYDVDGDGMADILWHNPLRSRMTVWRTRGTCVVDQGPELPAPSGGGWTVAAMRDFNGDALADVLWYDTVSRHVAVWLMRGPRILDPGPEIPGPPGDGWVAVTGRDFNRDGMADVIWNDRESDRIAVWLMRGTQVYEAGPAIPGPRGDGWSLASAIDTDGDGMADAIWQNTRTNRMAVWTMSGTHVATIGPEIPGPE